MLAQETNETPSVIQNDVKEPENSGSATVQPEKDNGSKVEQLQNQLLELSDRIQKQSAIIGKLTNEKKSQEVKTEVEPNTTEKTGEVSKYRELEEKLDNFQRRIQKQEKAATLSAIELSLVEAGASPQLAKEQADYFAYKLGDKISIDESEAGEVKRGIVDTDGIIVPMSQWAQAYIESDAGSYLKASKTGPSVKNIGTSASVAPKVKLNSSDYSKAYAEAHSKGKEAAENFTATYSLM